MHTSTRHIMDGRIRAKTPGQLRIVWQASAMRCLFVVNRNCIYKVFQLSPTGKNPDEGVVKFRAYGLGNSSLFMEWHEMMNEGTE
jgi:hypothetical protein